MPVYFLPAAGSAGVKRPTIIFTNGYDARSPICTSLPLSQRRRGYHSLRTGRDAL